MPEIAATQAVLWLGSLIAILMPHKIKPKPATITATATQKIQTHIPLLKLAYMTV
jgi:hypothetical protein